MDDYEIRAKAAEISVLYAAHMTPALMANGGIKMTTMELSPLAFAPEIVIYIKTGKLPDAIKAKVEKTG